MTTANAEQHLAWNGESGVRWAANAERRDAVLAPIAEAVLDAAAIAPGERVLDVGCGCGATTLAAAAATGSAGRVAGVDLSEPMLAVARERNRADHVSFTRADAQTDPLGGPFDVAISRFGTMFFEDPAAAFANVARHLDPGGRLCIATWQPMSDNPWLLVPGIPLLEYGELPDVVDPDRPGMFAQSDPAGVRAVLEASGFSEVASEPRTIPLTFGTTVEDALEYLAESGVGRSILDTIPPDRHPEALDAVRRSLAPHHRAGHGLVLDAGILVTTAVAG